MPGTIKDIVLAALDAALEGLPAPTSIEPFIDPDDDPLCDSDKIHAALSYITRGDAGLWSMYYYKMNEADIKSGRITWRMFLNELDKNFRNPMARANANRELYKMQPEHGESVVSFFQRFTRMRLIAQKEDPVFDRDLTDHLANVLPNRLVSMVFVDFLGVKDADIATAKYLLERGRIDQAERDARIAKANSREITYDLFCELAERCVRVQMELKELRAEKRAAGQRVAGYREAAKHAAEWIEAKKREATRRKAEQKRLEEREAEERAAAQKAAEQREAEKREAEKREAVRQEALRKEAMEAMQMELKRRWMEEREIERREAEQDFDHYHRYRAMKGTNGTGAPATHIRHSDRVSDRAGQLRRGECFKCGVRGHIARNCPTRVQGARRV